MIVPDIINDLIASTEGLTLSGEGMTEGGRIGHLYEGPSGLSLIVERCGLYVLA
jgi:hypothetical protein